VDLLIRPYTADDADDIVALALRAWEPVFNSTQDVLGKDLFVALRGEDWRQGQAADVRNTIGDPSVQTWVAHIDGTVGGLASAKFQPGAAMGEIVMVAVDPRHQRRGVGTALTEIATAWLGDKGASVVMVETGGDAGHDPARATYEGAGFTPLPVVRYFKTV
jgi:GNAT superfamily N-acetyltransferase